LPSGKKNYLASYFYVKPALFYTMHILTST